MNESEQRERESQESPDTKYEEAVEGDSDERKRLAERIDDPPPPKEENDDD